MAKFGHLLISGILWVLIAGAIGWFGLNLVERGGVFVVLGWAIAIGAFAFAGLSVLHISKTARGQRAASRWRRNDPEGFARAEERYEGATLQPEQEHKFRRQPAGPAVQSKLHDLDIGQFFAFVNYRDYYADFVVGLPNPDRVIAELFLFRAWTTQFGFRIFSSDPEVSEKIISEVVNQAKYLAKELLFEIERTDVEEDLSGSFMRLLDERWQAYDEKFLSYKDEFPPVPTRMICSQVMDYCDVHDPEKFTWLCQDFIRHLEAMKKEAVRAGVLA